MFQDYFLRISKSLLSARLYVYVPCIVCKISAFIVARGWPYTKRKGSVTPAKRAAWNSRHTRERRENMQAKLEMKEKKENASHDVSVHFTQSPAGAYKRAAIIGLHCERRSSASARSIGTWTTIGIPSARLSKKSTRRRPHAGAAAKKCKWAHYVNWLFKKSLTAHLIFCCCCWFFIYLTLRARVSWPAQIGNKPEEVTSSLRNRIFIKKKERKTRSTVKTYSKADSSNSHVRNVFQPRQSRIVAAQRYQLVSALYVYVYPFLLFLPMLENSERASVIIHRHFLFNVHV